MNKFFLFIIFIFLNKYIYANNLFETSYYNVEFTSQNIENHKIKEINQIKIDAILSIFKKTLNNYDYNEITNNLSDDLINTFVKNIIINDEKIINDKYFSKIKINFSKKKIIEFFRKKNLSYVDYYPDNLLLIIYEDNIINDNLFSENNNYYKYYKKNLENNKFFKIPNLDINDRYILKKNDLVNSDLKKIKNFTDKYNVNEAILVFAKKNKNITNYTLSLYSEGQLLEKKIKFDKTSIEEFFLVLHTEILNLWKKHHQIQTSSLETINCSIKYFNFLELKEIRNKLKNISVIKNLNIKSISYKNTQYSIYFYGNLKILYNLFKINNLKVKRKNNICEIKLI